MLIFPKSKTNALEKLVLICEKLSGTKLKAEQNRMKRRFSIILITASMFFAEEVLAEGPAPFPEFTFKRMKVPGAGTGKRITVQVDPSQVRAAPAEVETDIPPAEAPSAGIYDWYWASVSPSLSDSSSGRLEDAVNSLSNGPAGTSVAAPRLQHMQELANAYGIEILKATIDTKVSPALVLAVIGIESAGKTNAVSHAGASGLMQLMPATAERFGVADTTVAADNIKGGVAYLDWLMNEFDNDPVLILAAYNAGENSVKRHEGVPPFAETRAYVPKVLAAWSVARGLCLTPPQLISDGCVFVVAGSKTNG